MPEGMPIPPQLSGPPGPTGAVTTPQPQMGQAAGALSDIRNAVVALQKSLLGIPMGSELHAAVLKSVESISKHLDPSDKGPNKGVDLQALIQQAQQAAKSSPQNAVLRAAGSAPNMPPAMPAGGPPSQLA